MLKKIAEGVGSRESQRLIKEHKDSNPSLRERIEMGMPTGKFDVYIEVDDNE